MSEDAKRPREFQPVEDAREAEHLLKEGARTLAAAMIWTRDQKHVINTNLSLFSDSQRLLRTWCPPGFDARAFMDELARSGNHDCYFSVSLLRANIFFKSAFQGYDSGGLLFRLPDTVYKVQRRKDLRFPIPDGHVLKVEFQDPLFPESRIQRKAIDISAGGLSFLCPAEEESYYTQGLDLKDLSFKVQGKAIVCDAEVRHIQLLKNHARLDGVKIGVRFKNLKTEDNHHIAAYVFEESRRFYSRFL